MNDYTYDDIRVTYDEPNFFYDGGYDTVVSETRRVFGGGASTGSSINKKNNIYEILIRASSLNENKTSTKIHQITKNSSVKISAKKISIDINRIKISGSLLL